MQRTLQVSKKLEINNFNIPNITEKDVKEYVFKKFEDVKKSNNIKNLIAFQTMNKYMIMSHVQKELKILGNIIANYQKGQFSEIISDYEEHLKISLEKEPTVKTHSNVMMHVFGYFSKNFSQFEKELFFRLLKEYQDKKITIGKILSEINPIIHRFNSTYLATQTYFLIYSDLEPGNLFHVLAKK